MINLTRYLPGHLLDLAAYAKRSNSICFPEPNPADCGIRISSTEQMRQLVGEDENNHLFLHALGEVMAGGTKVITPSPAICSACENLELHLSPSDYAQPYPGVGVLIPSGVVAPHEVFACVSWTPGRMIFVGYHLMREDPYLYHFGMGSGQLATIEEGSSIGGNDISLDPSEIPQLHRVVRIALNLALFAVDRGISIETLSDREVKRRRKAERDERTARLVALDAQEITIQGLDLFLAPRISSPSSEPLGRRQTPHRRRGHWKMQPVGPGRSQRKRLFVHSYLVGFEDPTEANVESILS